MRSERSLLKHKSIWAAPLAPMLFVFGMSLGSVSAQADDGFQACPEISTRETIEVGAEISEFLERERLVILSGEVDVIQGPLRLRADKVLIAYQPDEDVSSLDGAAGTISKLEAIGNVKVDCGDEHMRGQTATYDIKARTIDLSGDVTLVRGQNILKGQMLSINLDTGKSRILGNAPNLSQSGDGRVQAIFNPPEKDESEDETQTPPEPNEPNSE